jgi:tetratricopeptide (TPR) repeat protein
MALDEQRNAPTKRLGSILVEMGFATEEECDRALTRSPLNTRIPIVLGFGALLVVLSALMVMPSSTDNIRSEIERLDNEIRQNPRDKALVQANLSQIGDIFLENLKEYHQAKAIYEEILRRFPRWEGNDAVYPRLAECYEALSDGEGAQSTYERMIEFFPATSPEYISARAKLDG